MQLAYSCEASSRLIKLRKPLPKLCVPVGFFFFNRGEATEDDGQITGSSATQKDKRRTFPHGSDRLTIRLVG